MASAGEARPVEPAARAFWLDGRHLRWPAAPVAARFRIVFGDRLIVRVGDVVAAGTRSLPLESAAAPLQADAEARWRWLAPGPTLRIVSADAARVRELLRTDAMLVAEDVDGRVAGATRLQVAGALDDLYAAAEQADDLGVRIEGGRTRFALWAPTAARVSLCVWGTARRARAQRLPMRRDDATGIWRATGRGDWTGRRYAYLVDVFVPGHGRVVNRVTDPYAISLDADSRRAWIGRLDDPALQPPGWRATPAPERVRHPTDLVIYELHVRDFSAGDATVRPAWRGKYLAFTEPASDGMRHLRALADAGVTDVHLLPVFDIASVPERGCVTPFPAGLPDGAEQQAAIAAVKDRDCFNWGYDPWHFNAPEGSYATDADDGAVRIRELRAMVMALHRAGLRVGMDVVYNHTTASGQHPKSVLDRIVPGYYHRLDAEGRVERSTCCDNTATEHRMMGKLLVDSVLLWARHHGIDSFRFDLMGHQPRALMERARDRLRRELGREIHFIGEGWNFGEVADGARFVQASQRALAGSGIGTFNDRLRDAVRGGGAGDDGEDQIRRQGFVTGLHYDPNPLAQGRASADDLRRSADLVRAGLAGSLAGYRLRTADGAEVTLGEIAYGDQPAGYAEQPTEVVNYVENHDNQTLYDAGVFKLPQATSTAERARVQMLAAAINLFSQGITYFHAGIELLRSKSMDRNSYDSGDWFNRLDWSGREHHFGTGLPPQRDNGRSWPLMQPLLADPALRARPQDIAWARAQFLDLLRIRASSALFRLPDAESVQARLTMLGAGPEQVPTLVVGRLDGRGLADAGFDELVYAVNVDVRERTLAVDALRGLPLVLHPVHRAAGAADRRAAEQARFDPGEGRLTVPPRTAVVFVRER